MWNADEQYAYCWDYPQNTRRPPEEYQEQYWHRHQEGYSISVWQQQEYGQQQQEYGQQQAAYYNCQSQEGFEQSDWNPQECAAYNGSQQWNGPPSFNSTNYYSRVYEWEQASYRGRPPQRGRGHRGGRSNPYQWSCRERRTLLPTPLLVNFPTRAGSYKEETKKREDSLTEEKRKSDSSLKEVTRKIDSSLEEVTRESDSSLEEVARKSDSSFEEETRKSDSFLKEKSGKSDTSPNVESKISEEVPQEKKATEKMPDCKESEREAKEATSTSTKDAKFENLAHKVEATGERSPKSGDMKYFKIPKYNRVLIERRKDQQGQRSPLQEPIDDVKKPTGVSSRRSSEEGRSPSSRKKLRPSSATRIPERRKTVSLDAAEVSRPTNSSYPKINFLRPNPRKEVEKDAAHARSVQKAANVSKEPSKSLSVNDYLVRNAQEMASPDSASARSVQCDKENSCAPANTPKSSSANSPVHRNLADSLKNVPKVPTDFREFPHYVLTELIPKINGTPVVESSSAASNTSPGKSSENVAVASSTEARKDSGRAFPRDFIKYPEGRGGRDKMDAVKDDKKHSREFLRSSHCQKKRNSSDLDRPYYRYRVESISKMTKNTPIFEDKTAYVSSSKTVDKNRESRSEPVTVDNPVENTERHLPKPTDEGRPDLTKVPNTPQQAIVVSGKAAASGRSTDEKYSPSKPTGSSTSSPTGSPAVVPLASSDDTLVQAESQLTITKEPTPENVSTDPVPLRGARWVEQIPEDVLEERIARIVGKFLKEQEKKKRSSGSSSKKSSRSRRPSEKSSSGNQRQSKDKPSTSSKRHSTERSSSSSRRRSDDKGSTSRRHSTENSVKQSSEVHSTRQSTDERKEEVKRSQSSSYRESDDDVQKKKRQRIRTPVELEEESLEAPPQPTEPSKSCVVQNPSPEEMMTQTPTRTSNAVDIVTAESSTTTDTASPAGSYAIPPKVQVDECHSTSVPTLSVDVIAIDSDDDMETPEVIANWLQNIKACQDLPPPECSMEIPNVYECAEERTEILGVYPAIPSPAYSTASTSSMKTVRLEQELQTQLDKLKQEDPYIEVIDLADDESPESNDVWNNLSELHKHHFKELCDLYFLCHRALKNFVSRIQDASSFTEAVRVAEEDRARKDLFETFLPYCKMMDNRKQEMAHSFAETELFVIFDVKLNKSILPALGSAVGYTQMVGLMKQLNKRKTKKNWTRCQPLTTPSGELTVVEEVQILLHLPHEYDVRSAVMLASVVAAAPRTSPQISAVTSSEVTPVISHVTSIPFVDVPIILKQEKESQEITSKEAGCVLSPKLFEDPPDVAPQLDLAEPMESSASTSMQRMPMLKTETKVCLECGVLAEIRCSYCVDTFYCSRHCQTLHWTTHQLVCLPKRLQLM